MILPELFFRFVTFSTSCECMAALGDRPCPQAVNLKKMIVKKYFERRGQIMTGQIMVIRMLFLMDCPLNKSFIVELSFTVSTNFIWESLPSSGYISTGSKNHFSNPAQEQELSKIADDDCIAHFNKWELGKNHQLSCIAFEA